MQRRPTIIIKLAGLFILSLTGAADAGPTDDLRAIYGAPVAEWPAPHLDHSVAPTDLAAQPLSPVANARLTDLGRDLFHDRNLSANGQTACADCHQPRHGLTQPRASAPGVGRNTPTLKAVALRRSWGWDGRHSTLSQAILAPLTDPAEMANLHLSQALDRAAPAYAARLSLTFGDADMTSQRVVQSIAAYLTSTVRPNRLDRFLRGEQGALTDAELRGLHLFRTTAGCLNCHSGPTLSDDGFHNLRLSAFGEPSQDLGRWNATGRADDAGRFRTPTLRGIGQTAPYMHSGHFTSLAGVVRFYRRGGGEVRARNAAEAARPLFEQAATLSPLIRPLDLTEDDIADLVAFLNAL